MTKNKIKRHLLIILSYGVLAIALTFPLILNMDSHVPGSLRYETGGALIELDAWQHIWTLEWVKNRILELKSPYYTDDLFYPEGVSLAFHNLLLAYFPFFLILRSFLDTLTAYNLFFILSFVLGAYCMHLLAYYLTKSRASSFIMGFAYGFSPYMFAHLFGNHLEEIAAWLIPLYVLVLIKTSKEGGRTNLILGSILLFSISLFCWYYFMYVFLFTALFLAFYFKRIRKENKIKIMAMGIIFLALISPFLYPMLKDKGRIEDTWGMSVSLSADLPGFLIPGFLHPFLSNIFNNVYASFTGIIWEVTNFLGYTLLFLFMYSLINRRKQAAFWTICFLFFLILSLGPYPHIFGRIYKFPLPYFIIYNLPFLSIMRTPARFVIMAMLSLCVVGGYSLKHIMRKVKNKKVLLGAVFLVICLEFLSVPFPLTEVSVPQVYGVLANDKSDYGIVELPLKDRKLMFYQLVHNKKITDGYLARTPTDAYGFIKNNSLILALEAGYSDPSREKLEIGDFSEEDLRGGYAELVKDNIRYVFFHYKDRLNQVETKQILDNLGLKGYRCEDILVYPLVDEDIISQDAICSSTGGNE